MSRILTGIQSTGRPHLGNLLGAILPAIELSKNPANDSLYFIADLHSLTTVRDPELLRQNTYAVAAAWLACGFDTEKNLFYRQSDVPQVTELTWYLSCFTPYPMLANAHSFKDKSDKLSDVNAGLFIYPVLMAADILAYHATRVPVGDDQRQHLELANDIAQKFNHDYGVDFFPAVEALIGGPAARVMSLRDGTKKMSKSDPSDQSRINLTDDADTIVLKIRRARTDAEPLPSETAGLDHRPEARNLVGIMAALLNSDAAAVLATHGGQGFGVFKDALAEMIVSQLAPIAGETRRLLADPGAVDAILRDGARRASAQADHIVREAERLVGFLQT